MYVNYQLNRNNIYLEKKTIEEFKKLTMLYKNDKPFEYYIGSRVRLVKKFLFHSGSFYIPFTFRETNIFGKLIKVLQSLLYYLALLIGVPLIIFMAIKKKELLLMSSIPIYLISFFPIGIQADEWRFFTPFYPFAIMGIILFFFYNKNNA